MYLYMGLIAVIPGVIYFTFFITRFLRNILGIHTNLLYEIIIGIIIVIISFPAMNTLELYGVIYYHFLVITVLLELLNVGLKRFSWYKFIFTSGILSIVITILFLGYGYYNINHVVATNYQISSNKIDNLKIIEIADLHMSTSININELRKYCDEMSQLNADIVVLAGDIFDENTPLEDMGKASKILSTIDNNLGIYYVYGNHDNGRYEGMAFGPGEIKENLENNGIIVLDDEVVCLDDVNIIGRKDASFWGNNPRLSSKALYQKIPEDKKNCYTILLDHQPLDLKENANLGVDLQLSGHTHGGQLFPMGVIQSLVSDTLVSGSREIKDFTAITSSGISGWRYPIKTGSRSEYVVINVKAK